MAGTRVPALQDAVLATKSVELVDIGNANLVDAAAVGLEGVHEAALLQVQSVDLVGIATNNQLAGSLQSEEGSPRHTLL